MPEGMEPRRSFRPWDLQPIENGIKHVLPQHVRVEGIAIILGEDEISRLIVLSPLFMAGENFPENLSIGKRPDTASRFGSDDLAAPEALLDLDDPGIEIDMPPLFSCRGHSPVLLGRQRPRFVDLFTRLLGWRAGCEFRICGICCSAPPGQNPHACFWTTSLRSTTRWSTSWNFWKGGSLLFARLPHAELPTTAAHHLEERLVGRRVNIDPGKFEREPRRRKSIDRILQRAGI